MRFVRDARDGGEQRKAVTRGGTRHRRSSGGVRQSRSRLVLTSLALCLVAVGCPDGGSSTGLNCAVELQAGMNDHIRAYADMAIFNIPAACLGVHPQSEMWASRWFEYGNRDAANGDTSRRGDFDISLLNYSSPVYDGTRLGRRRVFISKLYEWNNWRTAAFESSIPWRDDWTPSQSNDKELVIVDNSSGNEWGVWDVRDRFDLFNGCRLGYWDFHPEWGDLCVGGVSMGRTESGAASNFSKAVTGVPVSNGLSDVSVRTIGKMNPLALVPRLEEVEAGAIHHALNLEAFNTMFGPGCTDAQLAGYDPAVASNVVGVECGFAVAPASRIEHPVADNGSFGTSAVDRAKTVPEGMRFHITLTGDEIVRWLDRRYPVPEGTPGDALVVRQRSTAKIFAVALRDYGFYISDTSSWGSSIAADGSSDPDKARRWKALGLDVKNTVKWQGIDVEMDGPRLLDGLLSSATQVATLAVPDIGTCPHHICTGYL